MVNFSVVLDMNGEYRISEAVDEFGHPVVRTKLEFPYSYDGFVVWKGSQQGNSTVYSDRLYQQNPKRYDDLVRKHFGNTSQYWDTRKPNQIEAFLQYWLERPDLRLTLVMEYCNQSSGFPVWRFDYLFVTN